MTQTTKLLALCCLIGTTQGFSPQVALGGFYKLGVGPRGGFHPPRSLQQETRKLRGGWGNSDYTNQFANIGSGKCTINNGRDPKEEFLSNTNENQCKRACLRNNACSGYSAASSTGNCLLWLEGPLDTSNRYGAQWGGASCNVRLVNPIPDATVCRGYSCDTEGQFCPPSAPGGSPLFISSNKGFTCCAGRWKDGGKQTCPNSL